MCELWKYFLYVQKDTLGRSLRIHLRGFDLTVSEHFGNALNGHALRQCHLRCEGMPCHVIGQRFLNTAKPCYLFEVYVYRVASGYGQQIPLGRFVSESPRVNAPITLDNGSGFGK